MFQPSVYSGAYGADEPAEGDAGYSKYLEEYGPAVMNLIAGKTPREKYEILKAKIENQQKAYKKARLSITKNLLAANINKLQAQLRAAEYELAEDMETSEFLRYSKGLTIAGVSVGIGLAVLLAVQASRTMSAVRRAQDRK
jgi:hypothetical protein